MFLYLPLQTKFYFFLGLLRLITTTVILCLLVWSKVNFLKMTLPHKGDSNISLRKVRRLDTQVDNWDFSVGQFSLGAIVSFSLDFAHLVWIDGKHY